MSGVFSPDEPGITATDDPAIAQVHGLTEYDEESGQYTAPADDEDGDDEGDEPESNDEGVDPTQHPIAEDGTENPADEPPAL